MRSREVRRVAGAAPALLLLLALFASAGEEEASDLDALLRELDGLEVVGGRSVGFSGVESRFYRLFRRLEKAGGGSLPGRLLASPAPIRRSMGLVLLVARVGEEAVPVLRKRLHDRAPVTVNPFGCVQEWGSVGVVARGLLGNRNWIAHYSDWKPLLPKEELVAIDLELLGRDDSFQHHEHRGDLLLEAIDDGRLPLDLDALGKRHPEVPPTRIVKALGRLRSLDFHSDDQAKLDPWLEGLAADRDRPVPVRLAAASALCRFSWADHRAGKEGRPRGLPEAAPADLPEEALAVLRRDFAAVRRVRDEDDAVYAAGHALLAREIRGALYDLESPAAEEDERLPDLLARGLLRLVDRLDEWQPEWNTFGDGLYVLEAALAAYGDRLEREIGPERAARVRQSVRAAIAADG